MPSQRRWTVEEKREILEEYGRLRGGRRVGVASPSGVTSCVVCLGVVSRCWAAGDRATEWVAETDDAEE